MKRFTAQTRLVGLLSLLLSVWSTARAQITPLGDAFTNSAAATTNYGSSTLLYVDGATAVTYLQFDLASIPATASVSQATLKLYVNAVTTAGSFNVDYVNSAWAENTIDASNAPPLGTTIASQVSLTTADKNQYVLINVTAAVQAWLSGNETNNGIALVANGTFNATFDSKENTTTSHPAELDIAYAGGDGTITGVTTASGSGLTGGGTSGTLDLSLTKACGVNQVLQWNGTAWACATAGTGTITGVTAGTDLTGGGTSGNVTLKVDTTKVPQLAAANTFTGNQTVNGNLSATGTVSGGSYQIGSNLFAFGSYANSNAFLGFAGNTTTTGSLNTASGAYALGSNTTGSANTASGLFALYSNSTGSFNTASGAYTLENNNGSLNTAFGDQALSYNTTGNNNTATGANALQQNALGSNNVGVGYEALYSNSGDSAGDGWYNTAVGTQALYMNNDTGGTGYYADDNTAIGYQALYSNTMGPYNTATGDQALYANTGGGYNTATGYQALSSSESSANTATGSWALASNTIGESNAAFGLSALAENTTGSYNTAVGFAAAETNTTGSYLTCVGYYCDTGSDGLSNATAIGAHAIVGASNSLVLGGTGKYAVKVGIGTAAPSNILTIAQGAGHPVADSWETYSSRRWKANIKTLPNALAKVEKLRGVSYDMKDSGKHEIGVIAEEVGAVVPELVTYEANGKDARSVDYARLTALLIEAVKQQQREFQRQQSLLRASIRDLKSELRETRQSLQKVKAQMSSTQPALVAQKCPEAFSESPEAMERSTSQGRRP